MPFHGLMADKIEIRELIEDYCDAVALRDADQWAATWAEDASWILRDTTFSGRDNIVAAWRSAMDRFSFAGFQATPGLIEIEGDTARTRVHVQENLLEKSGNFLRIWGRYDDELIKSNGRWVFKTRKYSVLHTA